MIMMNHVATTYRVSGRGRTEMLAKGFGKPEHLVFLEQPQEAPHLVLVSNEHILFVRLMHTCEKLELGSTIVIQMKAQDDLMSAYSHFIALLIFFGVLNIFYDMQDHYMWEFGHKKILEYHIGANITEIFNTMPNSTIIIPMWADL
ncbi:hypothetical protein ACJX0J_026391 [Zea mays]